MNAPSERPRQIALQILLLAMAAAAIAWLLFALRAVLLLLAFTVIFCYLLAPLVDFFERSPGFGRWRLRMPRVLAVGVVYLLLAGLLAAAFDKVAPLLSDQLGAFVENAPQYARELDAYVKRVASQSRVSRLPQSWRQPLTDSLNSAIPGVVEWLESIALRAFQATKYLPWLVLIPVIGFFFLKDANAITAKLLTSLPRADLRYRATLFLKDVSETLAAYMRAQLLACLIVGVIEGVGFWLLGLSYPLMLGIIAGILEFVPVVGPALLGLSAVLVASFQSTRAALLVFAFLAAFRLIHDYLIYTRLISKGVEIHPVAVILAVLCGAELGGVIGVFLGVPIVALLTVCARHWRDLQLDRAPAIAGPSDMPSPRIEGILLED
ncbi:MAG: AI-2E family transporter [Blastocatellia bacterium]|nr:AI-2E family transporter [Blastocatellia bacterium]